MNILSGLFKNELAIDLGSVNTLIFAPSKGILLNEPSVVAIEKYTGDVLAVGREASKLLGRAPRDIEVHRPIRCGTIFNFEITKKMLEAFLRLVSDTPYRRNHIVVGVPGSATIVEQRSVRDVVKDVAGGKVELVDEGLAAGLGTGLLFEDERACMIVDIGGGTTTVAVIASGGVVSSVSLPAAGNAMDEAIRDYVRSNHCIQIGEITAERVKKEIGASFDDEAKPPRKWEIVGKHVIGGAATAIEIDTWEIREALEPIVAEIIAGINRVIEDSQPEAVADIYHSGITLAGGGALLKGIGKRLQQELQLRVRIPEDPATTVVLGAGKLLGEPKKLQRATIRQNLPAWQASEELVVSW
jgi:rod shape-determining protein MreB